MKSYLYIIDYWLPFPQSEYGGLINVIASSNDEVFALLSNEDFVTQNPEYIPKMRENIHSAQKLELADYYQPLVLEAFLT
tara:strand:- start:8 stop:247 length:240 start_codon:yes stop_codon:yes gene_type:complete